MALDDKGKPIATASDYSAFFGSTQGIAIMKDLKAQFEFHQPSFRTDEIINNPKGADTFAKLRDGAREVIQYLEARANQNPEPDTTP